MNIKNPFEAWNAMQRGKNSCVYECRSENRAVPDFTLENMFNGEV